MERVPFSPDELKIVGEHMKFSSIEPLPAPKYNTPISVKENYKNAIKRDGSAMWFPTTSDCLFVESRTNLDHVARAEIRDMGPIQPLEEKGGKDLFGIEWEFVPQVGGSMVRPGTPLLLDANDWKSLITFPDVNSLDWEGCKINAVLNKTDKMLGMTFQNGMFERLISFMEFEGAAMAIIDEEQQDAVKELFDKLADMYIEITKKYLEILDLDIIMFHDDWGSQKDCFFSPTLCSEMIVPFIKKYADWCHSQGLLFNHHSCGHNVKLTPCMIEEGDDIWQPQPMNEFDYLIDNYGDKITFSVPLPELPENATAKDMEAAAKKYVDKYAPQFFERPILVNAMGQPQEYLEAVYRLSRIALCGEK